MIDAAGAGRPLQRPPAVGTNLVSPADRVAARGRVVKAGRLTLAQSEVFAESGGRETLVALLTATLMAIENRDGVAD